jgi:filamentous hemagglutinin family protein
MRFTSKSFLLKTLLLAISGNLTFLAETGAQITPDRSLGEENSTVNSSDSRDRIDGGARRGDNLFHSFREFNVNEGRSAYFTNPDGVSNILTRVTGGNPSNILGTLGVNGSANLFLINPNGIIFGANARLDVGGSFFATTADSFLFDNGFEFSASNPQAPPLLTINIPIGLRLRDNPGSITNQSQYSNPSGQTNSDGTPVGLQVPNSETLALIGGDVLLEGGNLTAAEGRIEVGSVAGKSDTRE